MKAGHEDLLRGLNPPQREAVLHGDGPLLVLAGAGSGKTRVITHRIARLLRDGSDPDQVLAITFTNKAAGEMRERTEALCGAASRWISTFHSFAARILRRQIHRLPPYDSSFSIYDQDDSRSVIKDVLDELDIESGTVNARTVQAQISRLKNAGTDGSVDVRYATSLLERISARDVALIFELYRRRLEERNAVDFDDLLLLTIRIFKEHPEVAARYHDQFRHVLVDEYQDTNGIQYELIRHLVDREHDLCVTGDPDQSIYGWRGAQIRNILDFTEDFPGARVVRLEQNYRSTRCILDVANALISHNTARIPKELWTDGAAGDPVHVRRFATERHEAFEIADLVRELERDGVPYKDVAILYRINSISRAIEEEFFRAGMPYQIVGGTEFYQRREVKDILAYLQLLDNPRDAVAFERVINVPRRGIGKVALGRIRAAAREAGVAPFALLCTEEGASVLTAAARRGAAQFCALYKRLREESGIPVSRLIETIVEAMDYEMYLEQSDPHGYEERLLNVGELESAAREHDAREDGGLRSFLEQVRLMTSADRWSEESDRITLMTLHAAKGLEFPTVIIAAVEDGILPLLRRDDPVGDLEEERRLLYVGVTRARERLYLTHVANRQRFRESNRSFPSRFLGEIAAAGEGEHGPAVEFDEASARAEATRRAERSGWESGGAEVEDDDDHDGFEDDHLDDFGGFDVDEDPEPFPQGCRVYHDSYGEGDVVRVSRVGRRRYVTVEFEDGIEKQFAVGKVDLRKVRG